MFKGTQYIIGALVDDFAPVDDFLAALYEAAGRRDHRKEVFIHGVASQAVEFQVRFEVVVDVAAGEHLARERHCVGLHDVLISRTDGVHVLDGARGGVGADHGAHSRYAVAPQAFDVIAREHTDTVDVMEQVGQPGQQRDRHAFHPPLVEIVAQRLDHLTLYGQVYKVVRLVLPQDAVLLRLDFRVCLGYREVV